MKEESADVLGDYGALVFKGTNEDGEAVTVIAHLEPCMDETAAVQFDVSAACFFTLYSKELRGMADLVDEVLKSLPKTREG